MNLTTAEKWSMLFAAISCLHKKGIDKVLSTSEKKAFRVEMMALESSNLDIINQCHSLRELMKLDLTCLEYPLMKEIFQERLRSYGFTLVEMSSGLECNRLPSVYDDLEKKCRTGQRPDFLKKLKSFRSMESLDAEVALTVARECLEHKSTRTKRQGSSPGPRDNNKKAKTSQNSSQNAGKQATGTTVPSLMIQTTASAIPYPPLYVMPTTIQNRMMQTTASSIPTIPNAVMQRTASPLHIIHNQVMPTTLPSSQNPMTLTFASPIPTTQSPVIQSTASPVQPTQSQVLRSATSPRPVGQSPVISFDASYTTAATTHLRSQPVCTTSVISTQTTVTTSTVSPVNTNDPLLSSSGSHRYLISLDTSNMSLHDQARNIRDNAFPVSSTWTPWTQEPDSSSTLYPDLD
ncbi:uncharacterized threonine-rich GPI-anchored glycoprotein PJ4664.02-like isoform X4 [Mizuhopecten yessoensis]|uniref:uncharacterized threonine-rich GPI-anchored glycoprotein PJ4664.02-like isoform X4 n=1 Tax=Mizuhopecten yessoensis TaxID=6573 RepID=UPI000B45BB82|nr:uncharacterized threonine-rich GPI-anchored glycoprotein PJ4664.02-like isoform X4 [Mizuhopecten yessoensis]